MEFGVSLANWRHFRQRLGQEYLNLITTVTYCTANFPISCNYFSKKRQDEAVNELKAHLAREKMRKFAVKEPPPEKIIVDYGPAPAAKPYGSWKLVVNE